MKIMQKHKVYPTVRRYAKRRAQYNTALLIFNRRIKKFEAALKDMPEEYTMEHYTGDYGDYNAKKHRRQHTIDNYEAFRKYYQKQRRFLVNSIVLYKNIIENFKLIHQEAKKMPISVRFKAKERMEEQVLRKFNVQLEELYLESGHPQRAVI